MPGDVCEEDFREELVVIVDDVETEIKTIYQQLSLVNGGLKLRDLLMVYAELKNNIDNVFSDLYTIEEDQAREKRIIINGLSKSSNKLLQGKIFHQTANP